MKALQIKPNYNLDAAEIFKNMTYSYVQHFKSLDLLRLCDLKNLPQDFKSFVPNLATRKPDSRLLSVYAHAGTRQSFLDIEGVNLEVKGRKVAKIQGVSRGQKPLLKNTLSGDNHTDIIKIYHQWEPEDLTTCTTYPQGGTLLDAFVMLLSNGFCKETYHLSHLPTIQESKESFLAAFWSRADTNQIKNSKFKPYLGEVTSDRRGEIFFQTVEGYIGVSPTSVQDGDIISVLVGASVPIVLRPVIDHQDAYQVVGPCFLQGVMYGEFLLGPLPDDWLCVKHEDRRWCFRQQGSEKRTWEDPRLWPIPPHWQAHSCDFDDDNNGPCDGGCELAYEKAGQLMNRWFFNTQSKERSKDDPRLDVQGLEAGGIELESFTLV